MTGSPRWQNTIATSASVQGIGLHTGSISHLTFQPAPPDTGYVIVRTDLPGAPVVHPRHDRVCKTSRGTTLRENGVEVHTVEHVLAALAGLGIDNCRIELDANEPPIMDGSSLLFVEALLQAGRTEQPGHPVEVYRLDRVLTLEGPGGKSIAAWPHRGLRISYQLQYDQPWPPSARVDFDFSPEGFRQWLVPARTYCFEQEIAWLKSQGLAQGGSLDNAIVLTADGVKNGPLRFELELVYHKILDFIGDLALLGRPVEGHFVACRTGHEMNVQLVARLDAARIRNGESIGRNEKLIIQAHEIEQLLPHRYPMLLVDRVIDLEEGKRVVGIKNVTMNEHFFQGHFPGHPIMPGVLIVEAMAQCGGVLLMRSVGDASNKVVYFVSIDNVKFRKPVLPGDQLRFVLTVDKIRSRIAKMHGEAFVGDDLVCEADLVSTLMDR